MRSLHPLCYGSAAQPNGPRSKDGGCYFSFVLVLSPSFHVERSTELREITSGRRRTLSLCLQILFAGGCSTCMSSENNNEETF